MKKTLAGVLGVLAMLAVAMVAPPAQAQPPGRSDGGGGAVEVTAAVHHDTSARLADQPAQSTNDRPQHEHPLRTTMPTAPQTAQHDPVLQAGATSTAAPASGIGMAGVGNGDYGFVPNAAPPDTNGAVGATQYVQWVNESFAVFDKATGALVYGPTAGNTLWAGFGGGCQNNNDGDPIVQYDKAANRWVLTQFSVSTTPYLQCVAVSTTSDATGTYNRYSFTEPNFNDYPKLGVWPDAYYLTFNMFSGSSFAGPRVCALDRAAMLAGASATQQCIQLGSSYASLLPADLDGATAPPSGSPNYLVGMASNSLNLWKFHLDFANSSNTTLTGPTNVPVAAFSTACGGGTCIPQSGTRQKLDSLADRLMYRLAYRNFGDHESLIVSHAVTANSSTGIRWYELRNLSATPTVYQQGTYAPDGAYRWMSSAAMDHMGNLAVGYSVSSSTQHPAIRYAGRLVSDPLGTLGAESSIIEGGGSQLRNLSRWGDYSAMTVDPVDDCTLWFTNEYLKSNGTFNWSTRIASFKFAGCTTTPPPNDFSLSLSPTSLTLAPGNSGTSTVTTTTTNGSAQTVALSASGLPTGATPSFNPSSITSGSSSTLTVATSSSTPAGTYSIAVTGTGTATTHSATLTLVVPAPTSVTNGGFETGTLSGWGPSGLVSPTVVASPHTGTYAANLGSTKAFNGNSTLQQTVTIPTGASLSFWYNPHCPDTLTYDQQQAQIRSTSGAVLVNILNVCSNTGTWTLKTVDLSGLAGQTVVLYFNVHDDGYAADPTYMLLDDVTF